MILRRILYLLFVLSLAVVSSGCGGAGGSDSGGSSSQAFFQEGDSSPLVFDSTSSGYLLEEEVTPPQPQAFDVAMLSSYSLTSSSSDLLSFSPSPEGVSDVSSPTAHTNPEPATVLLFLLGASGVWIYGRRRRSDGS